MAVKLCAFITPEFIDKPYPKIIVKSILEGTTKSDYLKFLSNNRFNPIYHKYIRINAIMGSLVNSLIWLILIILTCKFLIPVSKLYYLLKGSLCTQLIVDLLTFFINNNSETSDLYIAKHPEEYIYRY